MALRSHLTFDSESTSFKVQHSALLGHGKIKLGHKSTSVSVQTSLANVTE